MQLDIEYLLEQGSAKPIPEFESYLAIDDGRIYSLLSSKFLIPYIVDGRRVFRLSKDGKRYGKHAARWIAMAFIGLLEEETMHVDHIDGDKTNDAAVNLQWLSHEENMVKARAKRFTVLSPAGDVVVGKNIRSFCREHNLHSGNFSKMLRGCEKFKSVRGWHLPLDEVA